MKDNKKKLIVFAESEVNKNYGDNSDVISLDELRNEISDFSFFKRLFRYDQVLFHCHSINTIFRPFLVLSLLKMLSKNKSLMVFKDESDQKISLWLIFTFLIKHIVEVLNSPFFLKKIKKEIFKIRKEDRTVKKINLSERPVYLRTDMSFNLVTGGSVGHIAGVLNNLDRFFKNSVFFSTTQIEPVKESVETHIIDYDGKYSVNKEISGLGFSETFSEKVKKILGNNIPAFIYQRYGLNNISGLQLSDFYNVPLVLEFNGSEVWAHRNWGDTLKFEEISLLIEKTNLQKADIVVVVSEPLKEEIVALGVEPERILVNPNGVDPEKYNLDVDGSEIRKKYDFEDKIVFGFIGTFGRWHGAEVLAEAFGKLLQEKPHLREKYRLLMIGDGLTMAEVKESIDKYNIKEEVILTGMIAQKNGPSHLAACDIFMSPHVPNPDGTKFFGSPTKLFEYMAMEKAIIASNLDQIGDILNHKDTAYMVRAGDIGELMKAMEIVAEDKELRVKLGKKARETVVEKYTWYKHTEKIINKLKETCE